MLHILELIGVGDLEKAFSVSSKAIKANKVLSLLEDCFDLISSPSPSMKIQVMGRKITGNLGFKLGFPTGQDFLVPRDKGTDVL